jgi:hypothetical protein
MILRARVSAAWVEKALSKNAARRKPTKVRMTNSFI